MRPALALGAAAAFATAMAASSLSHLNALLARRVAEPFAALTPKNRQSSPHARHDIEPAADAYHLEYEFRDHRGQPWRWRWRYARPVTDDDIARFGIPRSMFEPYRPAPGVVARRAKQLARGLFRRDGQSIGPDRPRIVEHYAPYAAPLATLARQTGGAQPREQVRALLKMLQDVPYGIPPVEDGGRFIAGILPTPQMFLEGWGDCDTKAFAMAAALQHLGMSTVLLRRPQHLLLGVEGIPRPYDRVFRHRGRRFILAEPAGPARHRFGEPQQPYPSFIGVELLPGAPGRNATVTVGDPEAEWVDGDVTLIEARREGGELHLEVRVKDGLHPVAAVDVDGTRLPYHRVFVDRLDGARARVRVGLGKPGRYDVQVAALPLSHTGRWTAAFSETFQIEGAVRPPRSFPNAARAFWRHRGRLRAPIAKRLRPGTKARLELELKGLDRILIRQPDTPEQPIEVVDGRAVGDVEVTGDELWVYGSAPGGKAPLLLLYFGGG